MILSGWKYKAIVQRLYLTVTDMHVEPLDLLCYLRQQSKYDETAKALFEDLFDSVRVSFITEDN